VLRWTPVDRACGLSLLHPETGQSLFGRPRNVALTWDDADAPAR
jgi:hypothetical protein